MSNTEQSGKSGEERWLSPAGPSSPPPPARGQPAEGQNQYGRSSSGSRDDQGAAGASFPDATPQGQPPQGQWGTPPQGQPQGQPPQGQWGTPPPWQSMPPGRFPGYQAPSKPGIIPLRPLGLGEILDGAFQACRKNPLATFGTAIVFQLIIGLGTLLATTGMLSSIAGFDTLSPTADEVTGLVASVVSLGTAATLLSGVGVLILQGALIIPIARAVLNQSTGFVQLWKLAARRILPLLGLGLLLTFLVVVGLLAFVLVSVGLVAAMNEWSVLVIVLGFFAVVVLMVWIGVKVLLAPAVLMLEGAGPITALKRSWTLTSRNWWRTFGIILLTSIIVSIITSVISTPLSFLVLQSVSFSDSPELLGPQLMESLPLLLVSQAITAVFAAIGYAFQAGVTALLYVDLRIRREGFDVVLMREHEQSNGLPGNRLPGQSASGAGAPPQQFGHRPDGPGSHRPGSAPEENGP